MASMVMLPTVADQHKGVDGKRELGAAAVVLTAGPITDHQLANVVNSGRGQAVRQVSPPEFQRRTPDAGANGCLRAAALRARRGPGVRLCQPVFRQQGRVLTPRLSR